MTDLKLGKDNPYEEKKNIIHTENTYHYTEDTYIYLTNRGHICTVHTLNIYGETHIQKDTYTQDTMHRKRACIIA